jgi:flagellar biosynthesis/type III secretory pathway protein FliH
LNTLKIPVMIFIILGMILMAGGCAKPPTEEMDKALAALTRAENDPDAVMYAANSIARARSALTQMQTEAAAKRYDAARTYAQETISAADRAITDGRAAALRAKDEAASLMSLLSASIAETEGAITSARKVRNSRLDFEALSRDFEGARRIFDQAQIAASAGNYPDALAKGQTVRQALSDINARISQAVMAVTRKK